MYLIKFFFICCFFSSTLFAQQDSLGVRYDSSKLNIKEITKSDLEEYKGDKDFNYAEAVAEKTFLTNIKSWLKNILTRFFEAIFGVGKVSGILYFLFKILPYLLLAFLIFLLIKFFLKVNFRNIITGEQKGPDVIIFDEENIIKNEDIRELISDAITLGNYRLAIRYYYLLILQQLSENQIIHWEQQKTNEDYINEIKIDTLKNDFKSITRLYDYIWYGEFNIDVLKFESIKPSFETFTNAIKSS